MANRKRPRKVFRLSYWRANPELAASVTLYGDPSEVRMSAGPKQFISVREEGLTFSPGFGNNINIQGLPQNMRYAGILKDLPFPLSIMPVTPFTPFPNQVFALPLKEVLPLIKDMIIIGTSFL